MDVTIIINDRSGAHPCINCVVNFTKMFCSLPVVYTNLFPDTRLYTLVPNAIFGPMTYQIQFLTLAIDWNNPCCIQR